MPIKLIAPEKKEFILDKSDALFENDDDSTRVLIRQARQGEKERRDNLFSEVKREAAPDITVNGQITERITTQFNYQQLKRIEVYLTLANCNITDVDGSDLFRFKDNKLAMTESEFKRAWDKLPDIIADEIHEKVLLVNPSWDARLGEGL